MTSIEQTRRLEGWMTFLEASRELGYTKQGIHRLVFASSRNPFNFDTDVRCAGERPLMLLREEAVMAVKARLKPADAVGWGMSRITPASDERDEAMPNNNEAEPGNGTAAEAVDRDMPGS